MYVRLVVGFSSTVHFCCCNCKAPPIQLASCQCLSHCDPFYNSLCSITKLFIYLYCHYHSHATRGEKICVRSLFYGIMTLMEASEFWIKTKLFSAWKTNSFVRSRCLSEVCGFCCSAPSRNPCSLFSAHEAAFPKIIIVVLN